MSGSENTRNTSTTLSTPSIYSLDHPEREHSSQSRSLIAKILSMLLWLEPFWIVALAPSLLLRDLFWDPWLHPWLIGALLLFWPLRFFIQRQLVPSTPLNMPIFALLLWSLMGVWMATDMERAWQAEGILVLGIALYVAAVNWPPMQQRSLAHTSSNRDLWLGIECCWS